MKPFALIIMFPFLFLALIIVTSCTKSEPVNHPPDAYFDIIPEMGDTTTIMTFDASLSTDPEDGAAELMVAWDLLGEFSYTEFSTSRVTQYRYDRPGTYTVNMQVIDTEGWVSVYSRQLVISDTLLQSR